MTLDEIRSLLTLSVPEAGQALGIGRDAAYAAAERGEIPVLHLGRSLRVPVHKFLELLGVPQTSHQFTPPPLQKWRDGTEPSRADLLSTRGAVAETVVNQ